MQKSPLSFINLEEIEAMAISKLPRMVSDYYAGGAETESTMKENRSYFSKIKLLPRVLIDVSKISTSNSIFGCDLAFPVIIAPMAMHGMAHKDKEPATARAASKYGLPFIFSTVATSGFREIAETGHPSLFFQLYVIKHRNIVESWVKEAELRGFKALVLTVDVPKFGKRESDVRNGFALPEGLELKNMAALRELQLKQRGSVSPLTDARGDPSGSSVEQLFATEIDDSLTWDVIPWLRSITKLPIVVKGILSPADALKALECGVDGIIISNHGGRQLDFAPSALEVLPAIAEVVAGRIPLIIDGGIRRGTDVIKALALGAKAVLLGRPVLYGLALGGQAGVERVLEILQHEFKLAMALCGCRSLAEVTPALVIPPSGGFTLLPGTSGLGGRSKL